MSENQPNTNLKQASLTYNSVCISKSRDRFRGMSGSSRYSGRYDSYLFEKKPKVSMNVPRGTLTSEKKDVPKSMNKSKVRRKVEAFFRLPMSKKFCAFYSVSFPLFMPDKSALKILNNVLTSLRQNSLQFQYIWVAERQKNGTIHFHILINRFLNIRVTNGLFARAIENEIKAAELNHIKFVRKKYNGCDVKYVRSYKGLKGYLTKYISKNEEKFMCRPWASSQIVSRLFTSISYHSGEVNLAMQLFFLNENNEPLYFSDDFFILYPLKHPPSDSVMRPLERANEMIANGFDGYDFTRKLEEVEPVINDIDINNPQYGQLELAFNEF